MIDKVHHWTNKLVRKNSPLDSESGMSSIEDLVFGAKGFKNTWISIEIKGFSLRVLKNHKGLNTWKKSTSQISAIRSCKVHVINIPDSFVLKSILSLVYYLPRLPVMWVTLRWWQFENVDDGTNIWFHYADDTLSMVEKIDHQHLKSAYAVFAINDPWLLISPSLVACGRTNLFW